MDNLPNIITTQLSSPAFYGLFLTGQSSLATQRTYDAAVRTFGIFLSPIAPLEGGAVVELLRGLEAAGERCPQANTLASAWKSQMLAEGRSPATINLRLAALRSLCDDARRLGLINWRLEISNEEAKAYRDTRGPGGDNVKRMIEAINDDDMIARRDRAILWLLFGLGMRRGKVANLDVSDLQGEILQTTRKRGGSQKFPRTLPPKVQTVLTDWLAVRPAVSEPDGRQPLFTNLDRVAPPGRLTGKSIWSIVVRRGRKVGIRTWPHALRHTAVTTVLEKTNGDLRAAQVFAEHSNANTTVKYDDNRRDRAGAAANLLCE